MKVSPHIDSNTAGKALPCPTINWLPKYARLPSEAVAELQAIYDKDRLAYLSKPERKVFAEKYGVSKVQIQHWFQNTRDREKHKTQDAAAALTQMRSNIAEGEEARNESTEEAAKNSSSAKRSASPAANAPKRLKVPAADDDASEHPAVVPGSKRNQQRKRLQLNTKALLEAYDGWTGGELTPDRCNHLAQELKMKSDAVNTWWRQETVRRSEIQAFLRWIRPAECKWPAVLKHKIEDFAARYTPTPFWSKIGLIVGLDAVADFFHIDEHWSALHGFLRRNPTPPPPPPPLAPALPAVRTLPWQDAESFQRYLKQLLSEALGPQDVEQMLKCLAINKICSPHVLARLTSTDLRELGCVSLGLRRAIQYVQDTLATHGFTAPPQTAAVIRPQITPPPAPPRSKQPPPPQLASTVRLPAVAPQPAVPNPPHQIYTAEQHALLLAQTRAQAQLQAQQLAQQQAQHAELRARAQAQLQAQVQAQARAQAQLSTAAAPPHIVKLEPKIPSPPRAPAPRTAVRLMHSTVLCPLEQFNQEIQKFPTKVELVQQSLKLYVANEITDNNFWENMRLILGGNEARTALLHRLDQLCTAAADSTPDFEILPSTSAYEVFGTTCQLCRQTLTAPRRGPGCRHSSLFDQHCFSLLNGDNIEAACPVAACSQRFTSAELVAIDLAAVLQAHPQKKMNTPPKEVIELLE